MNDCIRVKGARQHNLQNIDVDFPRGVLTAVSGLSGSGKSSLVFDTLYAEGQRCYVESLSTYARQFLDRLPKPDVDWIDGVSPAIAIEQRNAVTSGRSTVGTVTEINDYLRVLWARAGKVVCPDCEVPVTRDSADSIWKELRKDRDGAALLVCYPQALPEKGALPGWWEPMLAQGFQRVVLGDELVRLDDETIAQRPLPGAGAVLDVVVDRLKIDGRARSRFAEAVELCFHQAGGLAVVRDRELTFRLEYASDLRCNGCGRVFPEPTPRLFSFNSPEGACPACKGFGNRLEFDEDKIVPDPGLTLKEGAIKPWSTESFGRMFTGMLKFCARQDIATDVPFAKLPRKKQRLVLEGVDKSYTGVIPYLETMRKEMKKGHHRFFTRRFMGDTECRACGGSRLRSEALAVRLQGMHIGEIGKLSVEEALAKVAGIRLPKAVEAVAGEVRDEVLHRLRFLERVGLSYLTLDRMTRTLSGGEAQRIHLANAMGSRLVDTLYVLDEPTCGLHADDVDRLVGTLHDLVDGGNTVVVVEHDLAVLRAAEHFIELGPGAGSHGGQLVYQGPLEDLMATGDTLTAKHLRGDVPARDLARRREAPDRWLTVKGARLNNLREVDVRIPLRRFVALTGVSGSGKSSLMNGCLHDGLVAKVAGGTGRAFPFTSIQGQHGVSHVIRVDQTPIGKTSRSNPATYLQVLAPIRELFAGTKEALARGYAPGRFSFNTAGGRCATCQGMGYHRVEMQFMADIEVPCEDCRGSRFNASTLEIRYKGLSIAQVLDLTVDDALAFCGDVPAVGERLWFLKKVGLGYLTLGQPATTLSGGESQRLKVARELASPTGQDNLYLLDEPTTGLHAEDVRALVKVLHELVERKHSVVVIEHNLDLIAQADWIVDLGPGGGRHGGKVVAEGTPDQVAADAASVTGRHLAKRLQA
ncbi:MAG TPA: excinuclease ABC subunit UvrA [Candidatus Krumholzibacteria bacterium]|nr:excinuclease ABC subunit UvrA [Candidatus Krumholzibacteria bacterium]